MGAKRREAVTGSGWRAVTAVAALAVTQSLVGQVSVQPGTSTLATPAFEVVSVKPSGSTLVSPPPDVQVTVSSRSFQYTPGRLTCDQPLSDFIREAYSVRKDWQISGPDWLKFEKFTFEAIMPIGTTKETARLMLRTMLAERFGLKLHQEPKEIPVYALVVGRAGAKLSEVPNPGSYDMEGRLGQFTATAMPMDRFADYLSHIADRPVVNETGLKGIYKIALKWTPDFEYIDGGGRKDRGMLGVLEEQTGLKLERRRMPFPILVIDHVEKKPTPN